MDYDAESIARHRESRGKMGINQKPHLGGFEYGMVGLGGGKFEGRSNIFFLQMWIIL